LIDSVRARAGSFGLNADSGRDFFVRLELENVRDRAALRRASHLGNFINFFHVSASRRGEEHQIVMRGSGEEMLDEIAFLFLGRALACLHADDTFTPTALCTKRANCGAFDKTAISNADDAALVRNEVFHVDLGLIRSVFRKAWRTVSVTDFEQLFSDDRGNALLLAKTVAQILDPLDKLLVSLVA